MGNNLIFPFGQVGNANVATDAEWGADSVPLYGFTAGRAPSRKGNKAWKQAINPASGLGQFIADWSQLDFSDGLAPAAMSANLRMAAAAAMDGARMGADTGTTPNTITFPLAPLPPTLTGNRIIWFKVGATNTGASAATILKADGTQAFAPLPIKRKGGGDPQAGDLVQGNWYGATCDGSALTLLAVTKSEINALIAAATGTASGSFVPLAGIPIASDTPYVDWVWPTGYDFIRITGFFLGQVANVEVQVSVDGSTFRGGANDYSGGSFTTGTNGTAGTTYPNGNGQWMGLTILMDLSTGIAFAQGTMFRGSSSRNAMISVFTTGYQNTPGYQEGLSQASANFLGAAQKLRFIAASGNMRAGSYIIIEGLKY